MLGELALHHTHLVAITRRLRSVRWRSPLLVHAVVDRRRMSGGVIWSNLHRIPRLLCLRLLRRLGGLGGLLLSLFVGGLGGLLLLQPRSRCFVEVSVLEIRRGHKWPRELLLRDKWMQFCLLGRPSLQGIDLQKSPHKVDECNAIIEFCQSQ